MAKINTPLRIVGSVSRTLLGLVFIFSGFVKAVDPLGTTYKIEDYLNAFGSFFTTFLPIAQVLAWGLILFEFLLGFALLFNIKTKITSWFALAMMVVMTPLTLYLALTNPVSDCGCFGDAIVLTNWQTFYKNLVLLVLVIVLLVCKKHIPQTFTGLVEGIILLVGLAIALFMMIYAVCRLPLLDFRPYKVGNNIVELMEYPEDAEPDLYTYEFVYAKDGVEQTFGLDNYPKNDSSWVFVDQITTLVKKGYEPPIHDFTITDEQDDEITYDILESPTPVVLVVMYDLTKTNHKQAARLNALYDQTQAQGYQMYALTGSGTDLIEAFKEEFDPAFPVCTTDPVTLKTIVRANPGVIVVQNGTIIDKYNLANR